MFTLDRPTAEEFFEVYKGVLPEFWGLTPISKRTQSFIMKEWTQGSDAALEDGRITVDLNLTALSEPQR